jgi:hypothetical protein
MTLNKRRINTTLNEKLTYQILVIKIGNEKNYKRGFKKFNRIHPL